MYNNKLKTSSGAVRWWRLGVVLCVTLATTENVRADYETCIKGDCDYTQKGCERRASEDASHRQGICNDNLTGLLGNCAQADETAKSRCKQYAVSQWTECQKRDDQNSAKATEKCNDAHEDCVKQCKKDYGKSGPGYRTEECPPGTRPNPLGVCVTQFAPRESLPPGVAGCPSGEEPGADDRCRPKFTIKVIPLADGYLIPCPKGLKPSPVDGGCVLDDTARPEVDPSRCPPGTEPGPDDGPCVPKAKSLSPSEALNDLLESVAVTAIQTSRSIPVEILERLDSQVVWTNDPVHALQQIADQLGMEWERSCKTPY